MSIVGLIVINILEYITVKYLAKYLSKSPPPMIRPVMIIGGNVFNYIMGAMINALL